MRDVKALNALGDVRQAERVLQRLLHGLGLRLHHAEALNKRLLGVLRGQVDERAFFSALRDKYLDAAAALFRKQLFELGAVFKVDRREDVSRNVLLVDIDLLHQGGEEFSGMEGGCGRR